MIRHSIVTTCVVLIAGAVLASAGFAGDTTSPSSAAATPVKILVLTGNEYPGHLWRETAPLLAKFLSEDRRMACEVNEDPAFLASPKLDDYAAIVLNYLNWKCPDPGEQARAGLKRFVGNGKGLVIVHNACAAFQDWPEFREIAGRAWNPHRLRGHDPHGTFQVRLTGVDHPITKGLKPFETTDELYTCLLTEGRPIEVLARATSKIDQREYPMALVNHYGKGRVFLCVLGHDVKALSSPAVQELYRRGTAWTAGLSPVGP